MTYIANPTPSTKLFFAGIHMLAAYICLQAYICIHTYIYMIGSVKGPYRAKK